MNQHALTHHKSPHHHQIDPPPLQGNMKQHTLTHKSHEIAAAAAAAAARAGADPPDQPDQPNNGSSSASDGRPDSSADGRWRAHAVRLPRGWLAGGTRCSMAC